LRRTALGFFVALVSIVSSGAVARADVAEGYPGGCMVVDLVRITPTTCEFTSLGSDTLEVGFIGTGSYSITTSQAGCTNLETAQASVLSVEFPLGNCVYTVGMTQRGAVAVVDPNFSSVCLDVQGMGPNHPCVYDAIGTQGTAVAEVIAGTTFTTVSVAVSDVTSGFPGTPLVLPPSCTSSGIASVTVGCLYPETQDHAYEVTTTVSPSPPVAGPLLVATG
jgi:hypothetical protein